MNTWPHSVHSLSAASSLNSVWGVIWSTSCVTAARGWGCAGGAEKRFERRAVRAGGAPVAGHCICQPKTGGSRTWPPSSWISDSAAIALATTMGLASDSISCGVVWQGSTAR
jgi:hypothetical protein